MNKMHQKIIHNPDYRVIEEKQVDVIVTNTPIIQPY